MARFGKILRSIVMLMILAGFISGPFLDGAKASICFCAVDQGCCCCNDSDNQSNNDRRLIVYDSKCCCQLDHSEQPAELFIKSGIEIKPIGKFPLNISRTTLRVSVSQTDEEFPSRFEIIRNSGPPLYISHSSLLI